MNLGQAHALYKELTERFSKALKTAIIEWLPGGYTGDIEPDGTTFALVKDQRILMTFSVEQPTQGGYNAELPMPIMEDHVTFGCEIDCTTILVPAEQIDVKLDPFLEDYFHLL